MGKIHYGCRNPAKKQKGEEADGKDDGCIPKIPVESHRVSVGVQRLKAEGQPQVNFPIAAFTLGNIICFCKLPLGHISFCLLSISFCQETLTLPPHD